MISEISRYTYLIVASLVLYNLPIDIVILQKFIIQASDLPPIVIFLSRYIIKIASGAGGLCPRVLCGRLYYILFSIVQSIP
jgi:hypothetical protein